MHLFKVVCNYIVVCQIRTGFAWQDEQISSDAGLNGNADGMIVVRGRPGSEIRLFNQTVLSYHNGVNQLLM